MITTPTSRGQLRKIRIFCAARLDLGFGGIDTYGNALAVGDIMLVVNVVDLRVRLSCIPEAAFYARPVLYRARPCTLHKDRHKNVLCQASMVFLCRIILHWYFWGPFNMRGTFNRYNVTNEADMHQNDPKQFYELVMDSKLNPLSRIPDLNVRHMVMQLLAWMWCIVFSSWIGSILVFGISALVHAILLAGVFMTLATFEAAKRQPSYFGGLGRANGGEHE